MQLNHHGRLPTRSCWQGQEFRNFKLPGLVGTPCTSRCQQCPSISSPWSPCPKSGAFWNILWQAVFSFGWMVKSSEFYLLFLLPAVALTLWLTHILYVECCAIDYTEETGTQGDRCLLFSHKVRAPSLKMFIFRASELRQSTQIQLHL